MLNKIILFFLLIISTGTSFSQTLSKNVISKLGPEVSRMYEISPVLVKSSTGEQLYNLTLTAQKPTANDLIDVIIKTNDIDKLKSIGVSTVASFPDFVTARVKIDQIPVIANHDFVTSISIGETFYPTNDIARGMSGVDLVNNGYINETNYKGNGVIVCIIDTGIDWAHLDFSDPSDNTKSRILYIWDQTITITGSEKTPNDAHDEATFDGFTYGVEYSKTDIQDEIDASPAGFVREEDTNGHGTHVAGTAAGNGAALASNKYMGMAPSADIIVVKAGNGSFSSINIINGLAWAKAIASIENKPVVINMSLGGHANAHDGTSTQEVAVDNFSDAGRVAAIAAGNEGDNNIHITGIISNGSSVNISVVVPAYTPNAGIGDDSFGFDLWHDTSADVTVTVNSPNSQSYSRTTGSSGTSSTSDGSIYIYNSTDGSYTNGDTRNYIYVKDYTAVNLAAGTWTINIQNNSGSTRTYHGWLFSSSMGATLTGGNTDYTVGSPGTASEAITVGSYVSRWRWYATNGNGYYGGLPDRSDDISDFSSIGPRRDGLQKPDIVAPGQFIISCTSSDYTPAASSIIVAGTYHKNQGTSMSSPVVAGCIALLLEQNTTRTAADCKTLLTGNADSDSYTASVPNYTWGYGKLNAFAALAKAVNSGFTVNKSIYTYDDWSNNVSTGVAANVALAVKFTPTTSGELTGLFFHTSSTVDFTGNLSCEIWSDNGSGLPSAKLGSTVLMDVGSILPNSWNYVTMTGTGTTVTSGTNYHVVIYFTSGTSFSLRHDNSSSGRSSINNGSWASFGTGDLRIRPVVSTESSALPVELISFSGKYKKENVYLDWQTANEVNNYGWELERCGLIINQQTNYNWQSIGFISGSGNSNSPKSYSFVDNGVKGANSYLYRLKQIDTDGSFEYSPEVKIVVEKIEFVLNQNYPNPFNPSTRIKYQIPALNPEEHIFFNVKLTLYDILGQTVAYLVNEKQLAGSYEVEFNASTINQELPSGLYIYRIEVGDLFTQSNKMIYLK